MFAMLILISCAWCFMSGLFYLAARTGTLDIERFRKVGALEIAEERYFVGEITEEEFIGLVLNS